MSDSDEPSDLWDLRYQADSVGVRLGIIRDLVRAAAEKNPKAVQLLLEMLPMIDQLLADVQTALGQRKAK
jgi:hypothetical protein